MTARKPEPPDFPASQLFLRRLAYSLVRDEARAEDLVQDTWAAWIEHRPSGVAEPKAWLARVLRNRAFNLKRDEARRTQREELAGRPDPTNPETDGTLEAQAQLLEALRRLEEPYRSTLVQRYYHDLPPTAIAERAGTPLNTIKARLARGLEKLRAEMDRRYHGDRKAWCHWLTVMGAPPVPFATSPGTSPSSGAAGSGATSLAGAVPAAVGAGTSLLTWCGVAAVIALTSVWKSGLLRGPERGPRAGVSPTVPSVEPSNEPLHAARSRAARNEVAPEREDDSAARPRVAPAPLMTPAPEPVEVPIGYGAASTGPAFDWPQYRGGPEHTNVAANQDEIGSPKVLWFVPYCAGQPTIENGDLYTGGAALARLDPGTGRPKEILLDALGVTIEGSSLENLDEQPDNKELKAIAEVISQLGEREQEELVEWFRKLGSGDASVVRIAPAPVITRDRVYARRTSDGGVLACTRDLQVIWNWKSGWDENDTDSPATRVPLCLTDDGKVLVPLGHRLVALETRNGNELWHYTVAGSIQTTPAARGSTVFLGTDQGQFLALNSANGKRIWEMSSEGLGASTPMVAQGHIYFVDEPRNARRSQPSSGARIQAWDAASGRRLWESPFLSQQVTGLCLDANLGRLFVAMGSGVTSLGAVSGSMQLEIESTAELSGAPAVVGKNLIVADESGRLNSYQLNVQPRLRWSFSPPHGAKVQDFVHTGQRLYVATTIGLFCLVDDPKQAAAKGFVLEWSGDTSEPSYSDAEPK